MWYASHVLQWQFGQAGSNWTQPNRIEMENNQLMEVNYFAVLHRFKWIMAFMCRKNARRNGPWQWPSKMEQYKRKKKKNLYVSMFQSMTVAVAVAVVMANIRKALDSWNFNSNGNGNWNRNESVHSLDFSLLLLWWSIKDMVKVFRSIKWTHLITMPDLRLQNNFARYDFSSFVIFVFGFCGNRWNWYIWITTIYNQIRICHLIKKNEKISINNPCCHNCKFYTFPKCNCNRLQIYNWFIMWPIFCNASLE